jgi:hypothetical protein
MNCCPVLRASNAVGRVTSTGSVVILRAGLGKARGAGDQNLAHGERSEPWEGQCVHSEPAERAKD